MVSSLTECSVFPFLKFCLFAVWFFRLLFGGAISWRFFGSWFSLSGLTFMVLAYSEERHEEAILFVCCLGCLAATLLSFEGIELDNKRETIFKAFCLLGFYCVLWERFSSVGALPVFLTRHALLGSLFAAALLRNYILEQEHLCSVRSYWVQGLGLSSLFIALSALWIPNRAEEGFLALALSFLTLGYSSRANRLSKKSDL